MSNAERAFALLHGITRRDLDGMKPEQRKRLAETLRRIADIADPPTLPQAPRSGVLLDLYQGLRSL